MKTNENVEKCNLGGIYISIFDLMMVHQPCKAKVIISSAFSMK
jgi:hypothetical protein